MRVGIIALLQESNTFIHDRTTLRHFEQDLLAEGDDVRRRFFGSPHEVGGFFEGLDAAGVQAVPIFAARALPHSVIEAETFNTLLARMTACVQRAGPLDGLLVAPHGATVSETDPDADGAWLTRVREMVGPGKPIIGTLDLHANLSRAMVVACDALIAYRTNPHLDQKDRGLEAARLVIRAARKEIRPVMAARFPKMAINIERQLTADAHFQPLYELADQIGRTPGILSTSLVHGFPYADVAEMGASVLVVSDGDGEAANRYADQLAEEWWRRRDDFVGRLLDVDAAVASAGRLEGVTCLLDMGDNVGGGSPGDGTWLAHALAKKGPLPAFVCLADPGAVAVCQAVGVDGETPLSMGGKSDARHGTPFVADVKVRGLFDGKFTETQARHGGFTSFDQGDTVLVETESGLTVMLTSRRMAPFSLRQLTAFGIEPTRFRVLVAKGVHAPVAAYAPVCRNLLRVDTPGVTSADLNRLDYRHRRRPMFPFER